MVNSRPEGTAGRWRFDNPHDEADAGEGEAEGQEQKAFKEGRRTWRRKGYFCRNTNLESRKIYYYVTKTYRRPTSFAILSFTFFIIRGAGNTISAYFKLEVWVFVFQSSIFLYINAQRTVITNFLGNMFVIDVTSL